MINFLWVILIALGIIFSIITGNFTNLSSIILNSTSDAFNIFLKISFMIIFWSGMFNILKDTGYLKKLSKLLSKIIKPLFKELDENSKAIEYISITILSNILGLGVASTSTGLKAFEYLKEEAKDSKLPSKAMITFIILNITSFTIFPTTIISIRNNFGSTNDMDVLLIIMVVTFIGTLVGIILDKIFDKVMNR